jgi:peptidoglycan/LPS O-acetylase OafA/YrhL
MATTSIRPKPRSSGYIPTLDGWRTIAVFGVMAFHGPLYHLGRWSDSWLHENGALGVSLFFAISGLLICSRLLDEEAKNGAISLPAFYIRRTFRILPAMMAYLAIIGVLGLCRVIHVGLGSWLSSLFFFNNYFAYFVHDANWSLYTNHFWTLAVEEHFYLVLPFLLAFFPKLRGRLLLAMATLSLLWTFIHAVLTRHDPLAVYAGGRTELQIYALFFPAFLAVLLANHSVRERFAKFCRPWIVIPSSGLAWLVCLHVSYLLTHTLVIAVCFPLVVLSTVFHPGTWLGRILEWAPMRFLGRISYSLYLWQQLFFIHDVPRAAGFLGLLQATPWNLLSTLSMALLSYFLLEKPLMRLGHRLAPPPTPGHRDMEIQGVEPSL